jgi:hypothetical protein
VRRYIPMFLIALTITTAAACDENLSSIAGPDTPDLEPTFTSVQKDILRTAESGTGRRACVSCHTANGRTPAGGLNMDVPDPHAVLVNGASTRNPGQVFIVPGNPDASYLVKKLEGAPDIVGARMPLGGPYLKPGQIQILRRWIELGAPKN